MSTDDPDVVAAEVREVDRPSAEAEIEIEVHRLDDRYSATIEGREMAHLSFAEKEDGRVVVLSTVVEPEFRGRGIAADLIADVLDDLRDRGVRIAAVRCPVVAAFLEANPQYADLLDEG
ncbi:putative GNAT family acetyltransferase [Agromyces terreus]|uniref:GNAT family acetyltransferase n=1 Tax=Agromyces terreus TaxID=424795 RepID=A0A9X2GYD5_9MICO|nr:GNAT family N-acetyltransferase [Agromyces terreus]MCP2369676.1 putative GNAT family acetyltransferase [Agromyces terreus]